MSNWSSGYVTEVDYTFGYYNELNLLRPSWAMPFAGLAAPKIKTACELGFGQGLSTNIHAAATSASWHGTDFNPSQAAFAQQLASVSGADAHLFDDAFAEFCSRSDLPDFDYIGLHGIWTWISDENRAVIVDFIRRKLKVGGVLYISYNMLPGWSAASPLRHLIAQHAATMSPAGRGVLPGIDAALEFASQLLDTKPGLLSTAPQLGARLNRLKGQNRKYLAHEYFNRDWRPMYFSEIAENLASAKLQYAGSAHFLDHIDGINHSVEQLKLLGEIADPAFRETVRDYMTAQQFRRDYWIKGARRLSSAERAKTLRQQQIVLTMPPGEVKMEVTGTRGKANLGEPIYRPILDLLADYRARSVAEIEQALDGKGIAFPVLIQAVQILLGKGDVSLAQGDEAVAASEPKCRRLNEFVSELTLAGNDSVNVLTSPVTGAGVVVPALTQVFLRACQRGQPSIADLAAFALKLLNQQGRKMVKEGKSLDNEAESLAELARLAEEFTKRLPVYHALKLV